MRKFFIFLTILVIAAAGRFSVYVRRELRVLGTPAEGLIIEIPRGLGARQVIGLLNEKKGIESPGSALAYILYTGAWQRLQAGEYFFGHPETIPELVDKLVSGLAYLHHFTVAEGLTVDATAQKWQQEGYGSEEDFKSAPAPGVG